MDKDKEANKHIRQIKTHEEKIQKLERERLFTMPMSFTNGESGGEVQMLTPDKAIEEINRTINRETEPDMATETPNPVIHSETAEEKRLKEQIENMDKKHEIGKGTIKLLKDKLMMEELANKELKEKIIKLEHR